MVFPLKPPFSYGFPMVSSNFPIDIPSHHLRSATEPIRAAARPRVALAQQLPQRLLRGGARGGEQWPTDSALGIHKCVYVNLNK